MAPDASVTWAAPSARSTTTMSPERSSAATERARSPVAADSVAVADTLPSALLGNRSRRAVPSNVTPGGAPGDRRRPGRPVADRLGAAAGRLWNPCGATARRPGLPYCE
ncbi:hypothetical protein ADK58_16110 [Streptomyces sp. XY152]|nr:hypothetical protein ADK58_16110 [Streptomyces sp. XY152]